MLAIQIEFEKNIMEIINTIIEMTQPKQIIWFGSRVHLKEALDDSLGIFTVDLIDIDKVDPEFKNSILQNGVIVYEN